MKMLPSVIILCLIGAFFTFFGITSECVSGEFAEITFEDDSMVVVYRDILSGTNSDGVYQEHIISESPAQIEFGNELWAIKNYSTEYSLFLNQEEYTEGTVLQVNSNSFCFESNLCYSVIFVTNSLVNESFDSINVRSTDNCQIPKINQTKDWYRPIWNTNEDGTGSDIESDFIIQGKFLFKFANNLHQIFLYPKFVKDNYELTFNQGLGAGEVPDSILVSLDSSITIPEGLLSRSHYSFCSWKISDTTNYLYPGEIIADQAFMESIFTDGHKRVLCPEWEKLHYIITFVSNGYSGTVPNSIDFTVDSNIEIPSQNLSAKDKLSNGWNTQSDGLGTTLSGNILCTGDFIDSNFGDSRQMILYPVMIKDPMPDYIEASLTCMIFVALFAAIFFISVRRPN